MATRGTTPPVVVLRCTQRLLGRLRCPVEPSPPPSSTRLGDWYANLVYVGREQFVLAVSEKTFLPVVSEAAPISTLADRLRSAVRDVMRGIGVPHGDVEKEDIAMNEVVFARTASRQVLGVMNDLAFALPHHMGDGTLRDISLRLAMVPFSPLYKHTATPSPDRATVALFGGG